MFGVGLCYISNTEVMAHFWLWVVIHTVGCSFIDFISVNIERRLAGLLTALSIDSERYICPGEVVYSSEI